eukprot:m.179492 g.179492  ORF g.179492 m.179492 type:complete len:1774 (+) comp13569_c1_seq1:1310-6631(+)
MLQASSMQRRMFLTFMNRNQKSFHMKLGKVQVGLNCLPFPRILFFTAINDSSTLSSISDDVDEDFFASTSFDEANRESAFTFTSRHTHDTRQSRFANQSNASSTGLWTRTRSMEDLAIGHLEDMTFDVLKEAYRECDQKTEKQLQGLFSHFNFPPTNRQLLVRLMQSVQTPGHHTLLYGPNGWGKNIAVEMAATLTCKRFVSVNLYANSKPHVILEKLLNMCRPHHTLHHQMRDVKEKETARLTVLYLNLHTDCISMNMMRVLAAVLSQFPSSSTLSPEGLKFQVPYLATAKEVQASFVGLASDGIQRVDSMDGGIMDGEAKNVHARADNLKEGASVTSSSLNANIASCNMAFPASKSSSAMLLPRIHTSRLTSSDLGVALDADPSLQKDAIAVQLSQLFSSVGVSMQLPHVIIGCGEDCMVADGTPLDTAIRKYAVEPSLSFVCAERWEYEELVTAVKHMLRIREDVLVPSFSHCLARQERSAIGGGFYISIEDSFELFGTLVVEMVLQVHQRIEWQKKTGHSPMRMNVESNNVMPPFLHLVHTFCSTIVEFVAKRRVETEDQLAKISSILHTLSFKEKVKAQFNSELDRLKIEKETQWETVVWSRKRIEELDIRIHELLKQSEDVKEKMGIVKEEIVELEHVVDKIDASVKPIVSKAVSKLGKLTKADVDELRSYSNPPMVVLLVMSPLCLLFRGKMVYEGRDYPKGEEEPTWQEAKALLLQEGIFLRLEEYPLDDIRKPMIDRLSVYLDNPKFDVKKAKFVSKSCGILCEWISAAIQYAKVVEFCRPDKERHQTAKRRYSELQDTLDSITQEKRKIASEMNQLTGERGEIEEEFKQFETQFDAVKKKIERISIIANATQHVQNLCLEKKKSLEAQRERLLPDMLLAAASTLLLPKVFGDVRERLRAHWIEIVNASVFSCSKPFVLHKILPVGPLLKQQSFSDSIWRSFDRLWAGMAVTHSIFNVVNVKENLRLDGNTSAFDIKKKANIVVIDLFDTLSMELEERGVHTKRMNYVEFIRGRRKYVRAKSRRPKLSCAYTLRQGTKMNTGKGKREEAPPFLLFTSLGYGEEDAMTCILHNVDPALEFEWQGYQQSSFDGASKHREFEENLLMLIQNMDPSNFDNDELLSAITRLKFNEKSRRRNELKKLWMKATVHERRERYRSAAAVMAMIHTHAQFVSLASPFVWCTWKDVKHYIGSMLGGRGRLAQVVTQSSTNQSVHILSGSTDAAAGMLCDKVLEDLTLLLFSRCGVRFGRLSLATFLIHLLHKQDKLHKSYIELLGLLLRPTEVKEESSYVSISGHNGPPSWMDEETFARLQILARHKAFENSLLSSLSSHDADWKLYMDQLKQKRLIENQPHERGHAHSYGDDVTNLKEIENDLIDIEEDEEDDEEEEGGNGIGDSDSTVFLGDDGMGIGQINDFQEEGMYVAPSRKALKEFKKKEKLLSVIYFKRMLVAIALNPSYASRMLWQYVNLHLGSPARVVFKPHIPNILLGLDPLVSASSSHLYRRRVVVFHSEEACKCVVANRAACEKEDGKQQSGAGKVACSSCGSPNDGTDGLLHQIRQTLKDRLSTDVITIERKYRDGADALHKELKRANPAKWIVVVACSLATLQELHEGMLEVVKMVKQQQRLSSRQGTKTHAHDGTSKKKGILGVKGFSPTSSPQLNRRPVLPKISSSASTTSKHHGKSYDATATTEKGRAQTPTFSGDINFENVLVVIKSTHGRKDHHYVEADCLQHMEHYHIYPNEPSDEKNASRNDCAVVVNHLLSSL